MSKKDGDPRYERCPLCGRNRRTTDFIPRQPSAEEYLGSANPVTKRCVKCVVSMHRANLGRGEA